ncbi:heavy metal translocating P-type ATPase [Marinicellulosiphila megalodicopiae]|uniref:heavy metal translocating P-type ATPase n=1 Tax=Marinicellulosiphila megalodicopiae TaxID=2724896 RepID=UPI003BB0DE53
MAQSLCFHCQLPNTNQNISAKINDTKQYFCCYGCQAVALSISDSGLNQFYQYKKPSQNKTSLKKTRYEIYDSQAMLESIALKSNDECCEAKFTIEGISCAACVWLIEQRLKQENAIEFCYVNLSQSRLSLKWNQSKIALSRIMQICQEIGFTLSPYQADKHEAIQNKQAKSYLIKLAISAIASMQSMMNAVALYSGNISEQFELLMRYASLFLALPVVFYCASGFFKNTFRDLKQRHLTMDTPVAIAIGLAFIASVKATLLQVGEVYFESLCMFTFFLLLGRYLEFRTRLNQGSQGNQLASLVPQVCKLSNGDVINVNALKIGDQIICAIGEVVPCDGVVISGISEINASAINGEFKTIEKTPGDLVLAGCINVTEQLEVQVTQIGDGSSINQMSKLLERAMSEKTKLASLADSGASYFVLTVLCLSLSAYVFWMFFSPENAFWIALSVLVVTCPCALSLATPVAITQAVTTLSKMGLLVTRANAFEKLSKVKKIVFDKTGTLTKGEYQIINTQIYAELNQQECLNIAANLQLKSSHPIAMAFNQFLIQSLQISDFENQPSKGLQGMIKGKQYKIGHAQFCNIEEVGQNLVDHQVLYLTENNNVIAQFHLNDQIDSSAYLFVEKQKRLLPSVSLHILSGDPSSQVNVVANQLDISDFHNPLNAQQKLNWVVAQKDPCLMIGDGVNDAAVLAGASVSVAMSQGADLAKQQADSVLIRDDLSVLVDAILLSKKANKIIKQNVLWALIYNILAVPLAFMGLVTPWMAAIGMSLSSIIVVLNALRLRKV